MKRSDVLAAEKKLVSEKRMLVKVFQKREQHFGINHNPLGLLQNAALRPHIRPRELVTHDAAHILFSDGVVSCELNLLLPRMANTANLSVRKIGDAINAAWLFPKAMKGGGNPFKALWADTLRHTGSVKKSSKVSRLRSWQTHQLLHSC